MDRIRLRPFALLVVLGAVALIGLASRPDAYARTSRTHEPAAMGRPDLPFSQTLSLLPNSKENTSAIAQNNGTGPATIAMDIYTPAGVLIPSASIVFTNVPVGATRVFAQALNNNLAAGFRGVGLISSDQPINALLVRDIESNTGLKSYSIHNAYPTGGNVITLPYIANNLDGIYNTRFAIANTGTAQACVTIAYAFIPSGSFNDPGTGGGGCASGYGIPVGGQISFAATAIDGAIPMPSQTSNKLMAATVTSTGSTVTVGVDAFLNGGLKKLASYDGFVVNTAAPATDDIGTTIAIPLALKTADGYYSQILLSNPNGAAATASIKYQGGGQSYTVPISVPANGVATHSVYSDNVVPLGFIGAATVTSDQPLAAVLFRSKKVSPSSDIDEDLYTAVNGVPTDRATTSAKFPLIFRRAYKASGLDGYNTWVSVATADGGAATLTITAVNDTSNGAPGCGAAATYTATKTITGSFVFYQNLDDPAANGFNAAPGCFWGGMTITSDKPIIAIADATNDLNRGDNDGLYNAFGS